MKILKLQCDKIAYTLEKPLTGAEQITVEGVIKNQYYKVTLLLTTIQKNDEIEDFQKLFTRMQIRDEQVLIYPYAHLSRNLENVERAKNLIFKIQQQLETKYIVCRAPVAWGKRLELVEKPGSEQMLYDSYELIQRTPVKEILNTFYTDPLGTRIEDTVVNQMHVDQQPIKPVENGLFKPYVFLSGAYAGQPTLSPTYSFLHQKLKSFVDNIFLNEGYYPLKTPHLWLDKEKQVKAYFKHFPNRQFRVSEDSATFRIATCLGVMKYFKTLNIQESQLPLGYYDTSVQYRKEQKGELKGLRRLSVFTMSDLHVFCTPSTSFIEFEKCLRMISETYRKLGLKNLVITLRYLVDFQYKLPLVYELLQKYVFKNQFSKDFIEHEEITVRSYYWYLKLEFNYWPDSSYEPLQLGTIQIDDLNGINLALTYQSSDKKLSCNIIHCSILGSVERILEFYQQNLIPPCIYDNKFVLIPIYLQESDVIKFRKKLNRDIEVVPCTVHNGKPDLERTLKKLRAKRVDIFGFMVYGPKNIDSQLFNLQRMDGTIYKANLTLSALNSTLKEN